MMEEFSKDSEAPEIMSLPFRCILCGFTTTDHLFPRDEPVFDIMLTRGLKCPSCGKFPAREVMMNQLKGLDPSKNRRSKVAVRRVRAFPIPGDDG